MRGLVSVVLIYAVLICGVWSVMMFASHNYAYGVTTLACAAIALALLANVGRNNREGDMA